MPTKTTEYRVSLFRSVEDNQPVERLISWEQLVTSLTKFNIQREKGGPLWSPVGYGETKRRAIANVESIYLAVADIENSAEWESLKSIITRNGWNYIVHSTFRHTPESPRYRIIIPLDRPIPARDWYQVWERINAGVFNGANDPHSKDPSHMFFLPICPADSITFSESFSDGAPLCVDALPEVHSFTTESFTTPKGVKGREKWGGGDLMLEFEAEGAPVGSQRVEALRAIRRLVEWGYDPDTVVEKIWNGIQKCPIGDPENPWTIEDVVKMVNNIYTTDRPKPVQDEPEVERSVHPAETTPRKDLTPKEFEIISFKEMVRRYADFQFNWDIEHWLPTATLGFINGPPQAFKTWSMIDLAVSLSTGKPLFNKFKTLNTGPVIIIQQEDPPGYVLQRIATCYNIPKIKTEGEYDIIEVPEEPPLFFHTQRRLRLRDRDTLQALRRAVRTLKPIAVMMDPFYSMIETSDYGATAAQELLYLKEIKEEFRCSMIIVSHAGKQEKDRLRDTIWGSIFLNAVQEFSWNFRPVGNTNVSVMQRNFGKGARQYPEVAMTFNIEDPDSELSFDVDIEEQGYSRKDSDADTKFLVKAAEMIAAGVVEKQSDVQNVLQLSADRVSKIFKDLGAEKPKGSKIYTLPKDYAYPVD